MFGYSQRCVTYLKQTPLSLNKLYTYGVLEQLYIGNKLRCTHCRKYTTIRHPDTTTISSNIEKTNSSTDDPDVEGEADPFLRNEIRKYNIGKRWLARMMGGDVETFTQKDIDQSLQYLLPSHLWAKDARPQMKHPRDVFEKPHALQFDNHGRPFSPAFYTGKPKFHELVFDIWSHIERLNNRVSEDTTVVECVSDGGNQSMDAEGKQWIKQSRLEEFLNETMSKKNYDVIIFRLTKLASHECSSEIEDFLGQFQVPVYTAGQELLDAVDIYENAARSMGYRKTAIADVLVREGSGMITVNTRPLLDYFKLAHDREQVMIPLLVVDELDRFDIEAHVIGGGTSGKSGAIRLGISRAVAALYPQYFDTLNNAGLLTRDLRQKERKKPGRKKARRAFQWVKR